MTKVIMEEWWLGYNLSLRVYLEGSGKPSEEHEITGVALYKEGTLVRGIGKITPERVDVAAETDDLTKWTQREWDL